MDRLHRLLPTLVLALDAQKHEHVRRADLALLVDLKNPVDLGAQLRAARRRPFV